jgi:hypothetical protein
MALRCLTIARLLAVLLGVAAAVDGQDAVEKNGGNHNPAGLSFVLTTKNGQTSFHLGEILEIEEQYSSAVPGKYSLLQNPRKQEGGSAPTLTILPGAGVVDRRRYPRRVSADAILNAHCAVGSGGGEGGVCGDCDGVYKLGVEAIHFPYVLNYRFTITAPGHYRIRANAANVVSTDDMSQPIPISSKELDVEILRDDNWSDRQLRWAVGRYQEAQRNYQLNGWDVREPDAVEIVQQTETTLEMEKSAEIIRFLDTPDSLGEAVRLFDGSPRIARYENAFLEAILESSHRDLAVPLLAKRMLDEDFLVSVDFIDLLTAMTIQIEEPTAFDQGDRDSWQQLNPRALEILRGYVLALGRSLPSKRNGVRELGIATFEHYAAQEYCTNDPLIEKRLADEIALQVPLEMESFSNRLR